MIISYSLINAILLFNFAMVVIALLRHRTGYLTKYSTPALILLTMFGGFRVILPFSFSFTFVVNSFEIFPMIKSVLSTDIWPGANRLELQSAILLIWGAGSFIMLFRMVRCILKERMYRQRYRVAESPQVNHVVRGLQLKHKKIVVSPDVVVPYVTGFLRPQIFLPNIVMADHVLELILKHEYQHFKSRDILIKAYYTLLSIVFWWNPIVHIFLRELDRLLEIRCDETLTKCMDEDEKTLYMESLLFIAKHIMTKDTTRLMSVSSFIQAGQYGFIEQRFRLIQSNRNLKSSIKQIVSVSMVVMVFMASFLFIIQPASIPPEFDTGGVFRICPGNAYILITRDGSYMLYIDGQFVFELDEDLIIEEDYFKGLSIVEEDCLL
jgi:beta-lactamase regulating signal transducer with metallopeptidase domain